MSAIGVSLSSTCYDPIIQFGRQALSEVERHEAGPAMEMCARSVILSAGLVSLMADDNYNCALAHAVCYGLQHFEHVEREYLHGDLVAYGALVQLAVDGQLDKARELRAFLVSLGTPVTLAQMHVPLEKAALRDALIEATKTERDAAAREQIFVQAEMKVAEDMPVIPVYWRHEDYAASEKLVEGYARKPFQAYNFIYTKLAD